MDLRPIYFFNCGVIRIENKNFDYDLALEFAINSGAKNVKA